MYNGKKIRLRGMELSDVPNTQWASWRMMDVFIFAPGLDRRSVWTSFFVPKFERKAFKYSSGKSSVAVDFHLPLGSVAILLTLPTAWLWYIDNRAKPWQCPKCRYDLRGLDGGVCPECGAGSGIQSNKWMT